MKYPVVMVDPPWRYVLWSPRGQGRCAADHYTVQDAAWILNLPVTAIAEKNATLLLWATNPHMPLAFRVLDEWGFEHKTMYTWVKMTRAAAPRIGLGHHARGCTEHLIVAQRGNAPCPPPEERVPTVFFNPRGDHSAKPDYQYDIAEGYPGPYVELFHRPRGGMFEARPGWRFLGNEVDGLDMVEALRRLASEPDVPAEGPVAVKNNPPPSGAQAELLLI